MPNIYTVEIHHQGAVHTIAVPDDRSILDVANEDLGLDLPNSCNAGVCTTCAAQLLAGTVDQSEGLGISPEYQNQGYVLLCIAQPRSNLKIETEKEEVVYNLQFGRQQQK